MRSIKTLSLVQFNDKNCCGNVRDFSRNSVEFPWPRDCMAEQKELELSIQVERSRKARCFICLRGLCHSNRPSQRNILRPDLDI
jgi:hypothetical protein